MGIRAKLLPVLFLGLASSSIAQTRLIVYSGLNSPDVFNRQSLGFNFGFVAELPLSELVAIVPSFEYNRIHLTDRYVFGIGPLPAVRPSMSDGVSFFHAYRFLLEGKVFTKRTRPVILHVSSGGGYVLEDTRLPWTGATLMLDRFPLEGKNYWIHSIGIGLRSYPLNNVGVDLVAKYFTNYSDRFLTSINLGVVYQLGDG